MHLRTNLAGTLLMKTSNELLGAGRLGKLLADPEFLKLAEEAILAAENGTKQELIQSFEKLKPYILQALEMNSFSEGLSL